MYWTKSSIHGRFYIKERVKSQKGYKFLNEFLENLSLNFISSSNSFFEYTDMWAFSYHERQLHSILFPAINKSSDVCFREMPITRGDNSAKNKKNKQLLDYWVLKNDIPFLIEVKHCIKNYHTKSFSSGIKKKWEDMIEQLAEIKKAEAKRFKRRSNYVYKLGIMIVPVEFSTTNENPKFARSDDKNRQQILEYTRKIQESLKPSPDWVSIIQLNKWEKSSIDKKSNYPFILVLGFETIVDFK